MAIKNKVYAVGEILLRLDTKNNFSSFDHNFQVYYGGAEYNTLVGLSGLGINTNMISIAQDSFIGKIIRGQAAFNGINNEHILLAPGNQGMYFVENYFDHLPMQVTYNRENSVFIKHAALLKKITFGKKGDWLLISGISLLLAPQSAKVILSMVKKAKNRGLKIAFDFNYRSKLASYEVARQNYEEILKLADLVFAQKIDFVKIFNFDATLDEKSIFSKVLKDYPLQTIAYTRREFLNHNQQNLQGIVFQKNQFYQTKPKTFMPVDRIGGGDAFAAGIIFALLKNDNLIKQEDIEKAIHLAIHVQSHHGDNALLSETELANFIASYQSDIKR